MLIVAVVAGLGLAILLAGRYDLYDGKRWRSASEPKIAYAYVVLFLSLVVGGVALFFYAGEM